MAATLVSAHQLSKSFSARPLFEGLTFAIEAGERIGLIGPNGAGKSTLLRILASQQSPDTGTLSLQRGIRVGYLEQVPHFNADATVQSTVLEGTGGGFSEDWEQMALAQELMSKLSLSGSATESGAAGIHPETPVEILSGGWRKRVALARELARRPDLLLLDEPTNHLDVESILWLEDLLERAAFATVTITHDRVFLQRVSNRIVELDRRNPGGLLSVKGDYADYLDLKEQTLQAQERREVILKNTLRRETEWLRQGAKARTTKQQARINRAGDLKETVSELEYRNQNRSVRIDFQGTERSPKKLVEAKGIGKSYDGRKVFGDIDLVLRPGSRIGLLGPNGCGKSTLLKVLLGAETPDTGTVFRSDQLSVAWFEQNRETLDPLLTVARTVCPLGDFVDYRGARVHVRSYLDRFLFTSGQAEMTVGKLSGGEQSRLLIARLMLKEANLLVLDEPTNDLDIATLNVLEEVLREFPGAILLVTHDRYFLDQVANRILAFNPVAGRAGEIVAFSSLSQWEDWHTRELGAAEEARRSPPPKAKNAGAPAGPPSLQGGVAGASPVRKRKLGHKDQREWDVMERTIHAAEAKVADLSEKSQSREIVASPAKMRELAAALAEAQKEVERLYARWSELEALQ